MYWNATLELMRAIKPARRGDLPIRGSMLGDFLVIETDMPTGLVEYRERDYSRVLMHSFFDKFFHKILHIVVRAREMVLEQFRVTFCPFEELICMELGLV